MRLAFPPRPSPPTFLYHRRPSSSPSLLTYFRAARTCRRCAEKFLHHCQTLTSRTGRPHLQCFPPSLLLYNIWIKSIGIEKKAMEDPRSVNSPRRILSFSRNRKATVLVDSFPDVEEKTSVSGVSGELVPNYSEVYGFVGSISTAVALVVFLVWAYVPDPWLHSIGIFYYPSKYWALAIPTYVTVMVGLVLLFYIGLNFTATPPPTSFSSMFDEYSKEPLTSALSPEEDEQPIEPFSDIGIDQINDFMFNGSK